MAENKGSPEIPYYLWFGESSDVIGWEQISSHSIVACRGREEVTLCPDSAQFVRDFGWRRTAGCGEGDLRPLDFW